MAADYISQLTFCYGRAQRERFVNGELGLQWAKQYPQLFDEDDRRLYESQSELGFHFFEWLAAVMLYESTGYLSLIEKYGTSAHPRKLKLWEKIAPQALKDLSCESGWPDLFLYSPDHEDWLFCETKGKDKLSVAQHRCFKTMYREFGKKVYAVKFTEYRT